MTAHRTSYERAAAGYDEEFERALAGEIMEAIAKTSMVTDANVVVIRTAETASALLSVLAATLAMSPAATRSPSAIRKTMNELAKRLQRRVAATRTCQEFHDLIRCSFLNTDGGGHA